MIVQSRVKKTAQLRSARKKFRRLALEKLRRRSGAVSKNYIEFTEGELRRIPHIDDLLAAYSLINGPCPLEFDQSVNEFGLQWRASFEVLERYFNLTRYSGR